MNRDYHALFYPLLKHKWNQDKFSEIKKNDWEYPLHPDFLNYIFGQAPKTMKGWNNFIKKDSDLPNLTDKDIDDLVVDIYHLYTIVRQNNKNDLPNDNKEDILNDLLDKLREQPEPITSVWNPDRRVQLILTIKQLLGWKGLELDENNLPVLSALKDFLMDFTPVQIIPEDGVNENDAKKTAAIDYLIDNFNIPQNLQQEFAVENIQKDVIQMGVLKGPLMRRKKKRTPTKSKPNKQLQNDLQNPDKEGLQALPTDYSDEEEGIKNKKEKEPSSIEDSVIEEDKDIVNEFKHWILVMTWLKKTNVPVDEQVVENIVS